MTSHADLQKIGIIVLAAGNSSRLGTAKQLLKDKNGVSFIKRITALALSLSCKKVLCILGANHPAIAQELKDLKATIVINDLWSQGIASSIKLAVHTVNSQFPDLEALLFLVCDQPFVDEKILHQVIYQYFKSGQPIVASHYQNILGTPALFDRSFFPALSLLEGDRGAGKVIHDHSDRVAMIDFEDGLFDIDTQRDYELYSA
ncbi:MAG: nucleotidyltransferase family protein [Saprospiraceae bacterium]|nr:nucleotidyltransferase family protein [Saprospiraceae bacterium]